MNSRKTRSITLVKIKVATETRLMTVEPALIKNSSSRSTGSRCTNQQDDKVDDTQTERKDHYWRLRKQSFFKDKEPKASQQGTNGKSHMERTKSLTFEQDKKAVVNSSSCTSRSNTKLVSTANSANSKHSKEDSKDIQVCQDRSKLLLAL